MKALIVSLVLLSASTAFAAQSQMSCTWSLYSGRDGQTHTEIIDTNSLRDCADLSPGSTCNYQEGEDQFRAYAFNPQELANVKQGETITGHSLSGYCWKTCVVTDDTEMSCTPATPELYY